jgi:hypothetical protein
MSARTRSAPRQHGEVFNSFNKDNQSNPSTAEPRIEQSQAAHCSPRNNKSTMHQKKEKNKLLTTMVFTSETVRVGSHSTWNFSPLRVFTSNFIFLLSSYICRIGSPCLVLVLSRQCVVEKQYCMSCNINFKSPQCWAAMHGQLMRAANCRSCF